MNVTLLWTYTQNSGQFQLRLLIHQRITVCDNHIEIMSTTEGKTMNNDETKKQTVNSNYEQSPEGKPSSEEESKILIREESSVLTSSSFNQKHEVWVLVIAGGSFAIAAFSLFFTYLSHESSKKEGILREKEVAGLSDQLQILRDDLKLEEERNKLNQQHLETYKEQMMLFREQVTQAQKQIEISHKMMDLSNQRMAQNTEQLRIIALQNRITAQGVLYSHATEVTKAFLQKDNFPFSKHFYMGEEHIVVPLPKDADHDFRIRMDLLCELHTDLFENVLQHLVALDKNDAKSWIKYIHNVYDRTPAMRYYLRRYDTSYTDQLKLESRIDELYPNEKSPYDTQSDEVPIESSPK